MATAAPNIRSRSVSPQDRIASRPELSKRQSATVNALLDAGLEELREVGYEKLSVRTVAQRASVTHTTAYNYFTSKNHLIAEIYWRKMQAVPAPDVPPGASFVDRVRAAFEGPTSVVADEPSIARPIMVALLADEPDISRVRNDLGADIIERMHTALGDLEAPDVAETLLTAYSGAMTIAGTVTKDFRRVVEQMVTIARLIDPT